MPVRLQISVKEIVGLHALVGGTETVVVLASLKEQRVAGQRDIVAVQRVGLSDNLRHVLPLALAGARTKERAESRYDKQ